MALPARAPGARRRGLQLGTVGRRRRARHRQPDRRGGGGARRGGGAHGRRASRWPSGSTTNGPQLGNIPGRINPLHVMVGDQHALQRRPGRLLRQRRRHDARPPGVHPLGRPRPRELRGQALQRLRRVHDHRRAGRGPVRHPPHPARRDAAAILLDVARATRPRPGAPAAPHDQRGRPRGGGRAGRRAARAGRRRARAHRADDAPQGARPADLHLRRAARAHHRHDPLDAPPRRRARWPPTRWRWRCTPARTPRCCSRCT